MPGHGLRAGSGVAGAAAVLTLLGLRPELLLVGAAACRKAGWLGTTCRPHTQGSRAFADLLWSPVSKRVVQRDDASLGRHGAGSATTEFVRQLKKESEASFRSKRSLALPKLISGMGLWKRSAERQRVLAEHL